MTNSDIVGLPKPLGIEEVAKAIWLAEENRARVAIGLSPLDKVQSYANWSKKLVAARAAIEAYEQAALSGSPEG